MIKKNETYITTVNLFKSDVDSFKDKYHFSISTFIRLCIHLAVKSPEFFQEVLYNG